MKGNIMINKKELFKAFDLATAEFGPLYKTSKGFKGTYEKLPDVYKVVEPVLKKHGLKLHQEMEVRGGADILVTKVIHLETMEHFQSEFQLTLGPLDAGDSKFQEEGGMQTYHRRYQIKLLLGLCGEDDDRDGAKYVKPEKKTYSVPVEQYASSEHSNEQQVSMLDGEDESIEKISDKQVGLFKGRIRLFPDLEKQIYADYKISSAAYIPKADFNNILKLIDRAQGK